MRVQYHIAVANNQNEAATKAQLTNINKTEGEQKFFRLKYTLPLLSISFLLLLNFKPPETLKFARCLRHWNARRFHHRVSVKVIPCNDF